MSSRSENGWFWAKILTLLMGVSIIFKAGVALNKNDTNELVAVLVVWPIYAAVLGGLAFFLGWVFAPKQREEQTSPVPESEKLSQSAIPPAPEQQTNPMSASAELAHISDNKKSTAAEFGMVPKKNFKNDSDVADEFSELLKYSSQLRTAYNTISDLPEYYRQEFRRIVVSSNDPIFQANSAVDDLLEQHRKELNPFDSKEANYYLAYCRDNLGEDAAKLFETTYRRLGPSANPRELSEAIYREYQETVEQEATARQVSNAETIAIVIIVAICILSLLAIGK